LCSSRFLPPDFSFEFNIAPRRIPAYCPVGVRPRRERARANCGDGDIVDTGDIGDGDMWGSLVVFPCKILPWWAKE
jgi:hypothetical protein